MKPKTVILGATLLLANSCGLYNNFETPQTATETNPVGENVTLVADSLALDLPSWKELFTDSHLQGYIHTALTANSDLRIAALNITQAERGLATAKMAYIPSLTFSGEGSIRSFDGGTALKSYNLPLAASWEIDLFGKLRNAKQMSQAAVESSQTYEQLVKTQLIATVATTYYGMVSARQQLHLATQSRELMRQNVEVIESLKEVGKQNQAAVVQSRAALKEMDLTLQTLQQSIAQLESNLCLLMNEAPHTLACSDSFQMDDATELPQSISLASLSQRPDVRMAELSLRSSFYGVNYARAQLYPSLRLTGSAGWTNSGGGVIVNPGAMLLSALGSVTQPLFMAGRNRANLNNAKDQYEQQLIAFEKALLVGGKEVNDAMVAIETTNQKRIIDEERVELLASATEITSDLMESGRATYLEVLIAQNGYLAAQLNKVSLEYTHCINHITLYKALGGGCE